MLGKYFYHELTKKTIVGFGTLFNNIQLNRVNATTQATEVMKVPLAYGPKQKFLARILEQPDITAQKIQITLPRISFEMNGLSYDGSRKVSPTQAIKVVDASNKQKMQYMPVPYNLSFELAIIAKNQDDALQILEQILPHFQPHYNLLVKLVPGSNETKDIPVVLENINYEDSYEGDFTERRTIIYTLSFNVKTYYYGPMRTEDEDFKTIKKAQVDYYTNVDTVNAAREVRYTAVPDPLNATPDDNFGFNEIYSDFTDAEKWNPVTGEDEVV
jgi:hypothetical protein